MTTEVLFSGKDITMAAWYLCFLKVLSVDVKINKEYFFSELYHEFENKLFTHAMDIKDGKLAVTLRKALVGRCSPVRADNQPEARETASKREIVLA